MSFTAKGAKRRTESQRERIKYGERRKPTLGDIIGAILVVGFFLFGCGIALPILGGM